MDYNYCKFPSIENDTLKIENPYCYKIENLNVDWKNTSLLLHPYEKNKIDEIKIENKVKYWSYKLDDIKLELDDKYKLATLDKENYNFYNFLINTFWQKAKENNTSSSSETTKKITVEDTVIKIFKRNKLLWTTWDFSLLKGFLDIKYNDLIVTKENNWEYSIYIKSSIFNSELWKDLRYNWTLSSNYDFSKKHSLINPELKFIDTENNLTLLKWNNLSIIWEYKVDKIKIEIKKAMEGIQWLDIIANSINRSLKVNKMNILYKKNLNQYEFNLVYNWKILYIKIFNWIIINFTYNNTSYINESTKISDIEPILNKIKN
jgi:hypothetical protein